MHLLKPSTNSRKMKGESGNHFLIPRDGLNNGVANPLIRTAKWVEEMQPIIHFTTLREKLICRSMR
jgi:hypothetical protein